jgi:hypothetical protein
MADEVEFEGPGGLSHAMLEDFPLSGGPIVSCLVVQPENGTAARVKADSPEADALRKRYPALAGLKGATKKADAAKGA